MNKLLSMLIALLFFASTAIAQEGPVAIIDIHGPITPAKSTFLSYALERAKARDARLAVISLNTPGGLLTSMKQMVEDMLEAQVPTVVYVSPSGGGAISAGVFIAYAGNKLYMAPGTNMGAAHPVQSSGKDIGGDMREKVENYAVSLLKSIAERRGRDTQWAELAVRESVAITAQEAMDEKIIDGMAGSLDTLLQKLEGETVTVNAKPLLLEGLSDAPREQIEMTLRQHALDILCNPNVAILFGLGAALGIGLELMAPGLLIPGIFGSICLVLSLVASHSLPVTSGGAILLVVAAILGVVEFIIPSFGAFGIGSIVCFVLGAIYFVDMSNVWGASVLQVDIFFLLGMIFLAAVLMFTACLFIFRPKNLVRKHKKDLVGTVGEIVSAFKGSETRGHAYGKVKVGKLVLPAHFIDYSDEQLEKGKHVKISAIDDTEKHVLAKPYEIEGD